jgi:hypothetical protein
MIPRKFPSRSPSRRETQFVQCGAKVSARAFKNANRCFPSIDTFSRTSGNSSSTMRSSNQTYRGSLNTRDSDRPPPPPLTLSSLLSFDIAQNDRSERFADSHCGIRSNLARGSLRSRGGERERERNRTCIRDSVILIVLKGLKGLVWPRHRARSSAIRFDRKL